MVWKSLGRRQLLADEQAGLGVAGVNAVAAGHAALAVEDQRAALERVGVVVAGVYARAAGEAALGEELDFGLEGEAFGVVAPEAVERAALRTVVRMPGPSWSKNAEY